MDLWADFIEPASLAKAAITKSSLFPGISWARRKPASSCGDIAENGGTLILETAFGLFDERCFYNPVIPPYGLAEAFGYREKENYYHAAKERTRPARGYSGPRRSVRRPSRSTTARRFNSAIPFRFKLRRIRFSRRLK